MAETLILAAPFLATSASPIGVWWSGLGAFLLVVLAVYAACAAVSAVRCRRLDAAATAKYRKWRAAVDAAGALRPLNAPDVRLTAGEICYCRAVNVTLCELRDVRSGAAVAGSIRLAGGVTIHPGRFSSESRDEWRAVSTGTLFVTSRRVIFDGAKRNLAVPLSDIMSVQAEPRRVLVNLFKARKPVMFTSVNGRIFSDVVNAVGRRE